MGKIELPNNIFLVNVNNILSKEKQVTEEQENKETETKKCYVCGDGLRSQNENKINEKSGYADTSGTYTKIPEKYLEMKLWDERKAAVCPDCYKAYKTGVETYFQNLKNKR